MILPWNWNMGTVVLSIDAELCWGFHDWDSPPQDRLASARSGWQSLLSLCDEFDIPATWAIVGHIMLEDCDGEHPEHPTPPGWFDHERGPDAYPRDWRFGQDLVEATRDAGVDHDIGSHTFSHVELGAPTTSHRLARAELEANITAARQWDVEPTSFVFPRNNVGNRRVLAAYGFRCYRGVRPDEQQTGPITRRFRKLARGTVRTEPPPIRTSTESERSSRTWSGDEMPRTSKSARWPTSPTPRLPSTNGPNSNRSERGLTTFVGHLRYGRPNCSE